MNEELKNNPSQNPEETGTEEHKSYVPASIYKRVWAWVGVIYMVIIVLLMTYYIATWTFLTGITGIMLFPALGGFSIVKGIQAKKMEYKADKVMPMFWCILSGILCVICLIWGIWQLTQVF